MQELKPKTLDSLGRLYFDKYMLWAIGLDKTSLLKISVDGNKIIIEKHDAETCPTCGKPL